MQYQEVGTAKYNVIIIDGTWSQAKNMFLKNSLFHLPKQVRVLKDVVENINSVLSVAKPFFFLGSKSLNWVENLDLCVQLTQNYNMQVCTNVISQYNGTNTQIS